MMKRLITFFGLYLLIGYMNLFAGINIVNPYDENKVLKDMGVSYLPETGSNFVNFVLFFGYIYFAMKWLYLNQIVLLKFYIIMDVLFLIRLISFSLTIIPPINHDCISRGIGEPYIWYTLDVNSACSDSMFSGHAVHFTLLTLFTLHYSNSLERRIVSILYVPYMLMLVASRLHYSNDVFMGNLLTVLIYYLDMCLV